MLRMIAFLTLIASSTSLKQNLARSFEPVETRGISDYEERSETASDDPPASFSTKASLSEIKAKGEENPSNFTISHGLDGEEKVDLTAISRRGMARSETENPSILQWGPFLIIGAILQCLFPVAVMFCCFICVRACQVAKDLREQEHVCEDKAQPLAMAVSLAPKKRAAPAPLPDGVTEVDVLETFDSYDKQRSGFITREVLEGLIGPDEAAQGNAMKSIGQVDKLFYHDFRKLVLQPGPVQNAVANAAARKRGMPLELGNKA